ADGRALGRRLASSRPRVLVAGAGVAGRSVAYHLCRLAFDVTLIDPGPDPSATTRASLGVLTHCNGLDSPLSRLYRDGHQGYASLAADLAAETGIDIGWRALGGIDLVLTEADEAEAEEELRFNQERGCPVERLDAAAVRSLEPRVCPACRGGLYFPGDHRVDPERLSAALLQSVVLQGGKVCFGEALQGFAEAGPSGLVARTSAGTIPADFAVLAAGSWTGELAQTLGARVPVRPVRGQHLRFPGESVAHVVRHGGHHLLPASGQTVVGATVEEVGFELSTTPEAARVLGEALARVQGTAAPPDTPPAAPRSQRAGLRPKPKGGRPLIGPLQDFPRVFVATGHYKSGILMGPVTGQIVAEWMARGEAPRDMGHFEPER
ncbi:MAG: FAD-dependent oxidoreductase, partial [Candidatus Latescibacterota bacterium]